MADKSDYKAFNVELRAFCHFLHTLVPQDKCIRELYDNVLLGMTTMPKYPMQLFWAKLEPLQDRVRAHDVTLFTRTPSTFLQKIPIEYYLEQPHITEQVRHEFWGRLNTLVDHALLIHPTDAVRNVMTQAAQQVFLQLRQRGNQGMSKEDIRDMTREQALSLLRVQRCSERSRAPDI